MIVLLSAPVKQWECPSCGRQERRAVDLKLDGFVRSPSHACPKTGMITFYVEVPEGANDLGGSFRHTIHEREDYIGDELVQLSTTTGRPVMAIHTERRDDSGFDTTVYAPCATRRED